MIECQICKNSISHMNAVNRHFKKYHPEMTKQLYFDNYLLKDNKDLCEYCGKKTKFISIKIGYNRFCCASCSNKGSVEVYKKTMTEKYGSSHPMKCEDIKLKVKTTNNEKYGNNCSLHGKDIELKTKLAWDKNYGEGKTPLNSTSTNIREKITKTNLERFNSTTPAGNPEIMKKISATNIERYGVDCVFKSSDIIEKIKNTQIERYGDLYCRTEVCKENIRKKLKEIDIDTIRQNAVFEKYGMHYSKTIQFADQVTANMIEKFSFINDHIINYSIGEGFECKCSSCNKNYFITNVELKTRISDSDVLCTLCNIKDTFRSKYEMELCKLLDLNNIKYEYSNRTILNGLELDILIPSKNIAIEFNGTYWHSEKFKHQSYHLSKTENCEKNDIQLIHIFEDDWIYKQNIVISRLKSLLGISNTKIFARKCSIKELNIKETKLFLEENHIQGSINSKYKYGLFFNNELVSCMTFGNSRFEKDKIELHRFANKLNHNIIGGASKLFKHFVNKNISSSIISYADRSWSLGKLYETLNFKLIKKTPCNYSYVIGNKRFNRFKFRKSELIKDGFDINMTEHDIMKLRKIYRIYDSGSLKYEYNTTNLV